MRDRPVEVHPEEPGQKAQRQEDRGDDRELLRRLALAVRDHRQVEVGAPGDHVVISVELVGDADEMVVDVAEIVVAVRLHARQVRDHLHLPGEQIPHRHHGAAEGEQQALEPEGLLQLLASAARDDRILEGVDLLVQVAEHGEVAVHDHIDDLVDVVALALGRDRVLQQRAHLAQVLEPVAVHRDDVLPGEMAVHLLQRVVVLVLGVRGHGRVQHEQRSLAVHIQLRALAHPLGVLDRQRMPAEDGADLLDLGGGRRDQIQPEELVLRAQLRDQIPVEGVQDAHVRSR